MKPVITRATSSVAEKGIRDISSNNLSLRHSFAHSFAPSSVNRASFKPSPHSFAPDAGMR